MKVVEERAMASEPVHCQKYTLTEAQVISFIRDADPSGPLHLVTLEYNWGPPISGRFDEDYLQLWVVAQTDLKPERVEVLATPWNTPQPMSPVGTEGDYTLYFISGEPPYDGARDPQFVIRMTTAEGQVIYDNNGGYERNFRLTPYVGRWASVFADGEVLYPIQSEGFAGPFVRGIAHYTLAG